MKRGHLLQDPHFIAPLTAAESVFVEADAKATAEGLLLTDSNVRLILIQALEALAETDEPRKVHAHLKKKELFYQQTANALAAKFEELQQSPADGHSLTLEEWRNVLSAMQDYVETESPRLPRARVYLEQMKRGVK